MTNTREPAARVVEVTVRPVFHTISGPQTRGATTHMLTESEAAKVLAIIDAREEEA